MVRRVLLSSGIPVACKEEKKKKGAKSSVVKEIEKMKKQREERRERYEREKNERARIIATNRAEGRNGTVFC